VQRLTAHYIQNNLGVVPLLRQFDNGNLAAGAYGGNLPREEFKRYCARVGDQLIALTHPNTFAIGNGDIGA